ncbi:MAG TPA: DUF929 family protein [Solirubrobacteraceae bacterium]|nr:DUF929 family protein [Solirubrobacteraceae bacterium]
MSVRQRTIVALLVALATLLPAATAQAASRSDGSKPASAKLTRLVTHVPVKTLDRIGSGAASRSAYALKSAPLHSGEKPVLLTVNMAWCPHCAANSWALAIALSRFGKLTGLRTLDTGTLYATKYHANPSYPHTPGLSFFGAKYSSSYLRLRSVVMQDLKGKSLQALGSREREAIEPFDPQLAVPAISVGGAYGYLGSKYSPQALAHKSPLRIARALADPAGALAHQIDGQANVLTAAICAVTKGRPVAVCSSPAVVSSAPVPEQLPAEEGEVVPA